MDPDRFFTALWQDFAKIAPHAAAIRQSLMERGETVVNDHVAFRTFDACPIDLDSLEPVVTALGYRRLDEYHFEAKHLRARAYLCPGHPRIFVSELLREELGESSRQAMSALVKQIPEGFARGPEVFWAGRPWAAPTHESYERLSRESEYAGWLSALGLHANHFTVSINALSQIGGVEDILQFVEAGGHRVNESGGRVKGDATVLLEQGSTLADQVSVEFADGYHTVPTCYYEFALRHPDATGQLYEGFVPASANRIFESTHR